jgi:hypothetical protein
LAGLAPYFKEIVQDSRETKDTEPWDNDDSYFGAIDVEEEEDEDEEDVEEYVEEDVEEDVEAVVSDPDKSVQEKNDPKPPPSTDQQKNPPSKVES